MTAGLTIVPVDLGPAAAGWFTGRAGGPDQGNLSHRRPHVPSRLAARRRELADRLDLTVDQLHFMRQVHGDAVGTVDASTTCGAELRGVDALVTAQPGRALCVQVADCVPLLLASVAGPVAAVHVGRRGLVAGVVRQALTRLAELGAGPDSLRAALGPAIGGCCYEVPDALQAEVVAEHPAAAARTTWGTPSLDLPAAVRAVLDDAGVREVGGPLACTRCDERARWFSHRADPGAGRQLGVVVRAA